MGPIEVVAGILVCGDLVLLARRGPGQRHAGFWEFPGGKREAGESPKECLARELNEELGIEGVVGDEVARTVYCYEHGAIELTGYWVRVEEKTVQLRVHDAVEWVTPERLLDFRLAPADVPVARTVTELMASVT